MKTVGTYTLEDYLCSLHSGSWFGFNNLNGNEANKTYDDQANSTTTWVDAINAIKAAHPKP